MSTVITSYSIHYTKLYESYGPGRYDRRYEESGLDGKFLPVGSGGEPIRNPDSYPTGKNFYGIDPDKVPKRAAWALGVKLADQMLAAHL